MDIQKSNNRKCENLCRACLELLDEDTLCIKHNIFMTPDLAKKLIVCTSLTALPEDEFPKNLCDCCYNKLNEFHKFQTMCVDSVKQLQEMLQRQVTENLDFEDEKPDFDLEAQAKFEITVTEPDIFKSDESVDVLAGDLDDTVSLDVPSIFRRRGRKAKSLKDPTQNELQIKTNRRCSVRSLRKQNSILLDKEKLNHGPDVDSSDIGDKDECTTSDNEAHSEGDQTEMTNFSSERSMESPRRKRTYRKRPVDGSDADSKSPKKSQVFQCDICPTRFFVEHRLLAHKRSHDGLMPYPCTFEGCDKGFNRWHCLSEHLKQHDGTNQWFACEEEGCGKVYKHKPTLSMHLRKYHKKGPELKSHICEICGKVFKASAILNDHRYTHKDKSELPFACAEKNCDRRFSSKEKLKVHMMRHAGIKNYVCPYCGMRKTTRNELKIHINYHTLERTWPCRFCQHVCNSAGNLKMHVRTVHERAKDYACRFCERTFAKPDTRKYHEMTHTGEKPNECKECGKRFTQPAALRTHRKIHLRHRVQQSMVTINAASGIEPQLEVARNVMCEMQATISPPKMQLIQQADM